MNSCFRDIQNRLKFLAIPFSWFALQISPLSGTLSGGMKTNVLMLQKFVRVLFLCNNLPSEERVSICEETGMSYCILFT